MQQYIINLTNSLIGKNRYDALPPMEMHALVGHVKADLDAGDVRTMNPETLGRILCSLEIGDVLAGKAELFSQLHFAGDCGDLLRELAALALAYVIRDRLHPEASASSVPPYGSHGKRTRHKHS